MTGLSYTRSKIGRRLVMQTVLFSSVITLVLTIVQLVVEYGEEMDKNLDNQQIITDTLLHSLGESVWGYDEAQIGLQLGGILNMPNIEQVVLVLPEGERFSAGRVRSNIIDEVTFDVPYLIEEQQRTIATLAITVSMDQSYWALIKLAGLLLVFNAAKTSLVVFFMLYLLDRLVGCQMRQVIDYLQNYQQDKQMGLLKLECESQARNDEFDLLVKSLNDMQLRNQLQQQQVLAESQKREQIQQQLFKQNDQLLRLERQISLGEMASTLAHELNQPLTSVVGYSDICRRLLKQPSVDIDRVLEGLDKLSDNADRATALIRRTRDVVKCRGYSKEVIDVNELLTESVQLVAHNLNESHVQVSLQLLAAPQLLLVDRVQMEQVIINLLRNAMDALAVKPQQQRDIDIIVREEGDSVRLNICDNGCGLPAELEGELFRPFVTSKKDGFGVGLAISQGIVEAMDGTISAENLASGGSQFSVVLPKYRPAAATDSSELSPTTEKVV